MPEIGTTEETRLEQSLDAEPLEHVRGGSLPPTGTPEPPDDGDPDTPH